MSQYFLGIETATKICSVALFKESELIDSIEEGGEYSHAEKLAPFIDDLLKRNQLKVDDLSAVAVSSGPGSYTGLRIGVSLAKAICFAAKIPLIAISTLQGMIEGAIDKITDNEAFYTAMIDARRMEVYALIANSNGDQLSQAQAIVIDENSFAKELENTTVYFFGDGASKCKEVIDHSNASFLDETFISAANWGKLISSKFKAEEFEDLAYFEPNYLKSFRAVKSKPLL